jgi:hypothetical protein
MNPVGQCRLCHKEKELMDSHLVSKAAYKQIHGPGPEDHPFVVNVDKAVQTPDQITGYVLCSKCEQKLNRGGEKAFFGYCLRHDGSFRLLAELRKQKIFYEDDNFIFYRVPQSLRRIISQLAYFGVSIFWRSSVFPWAVLDERVGRIHFGKVYQEQFRTFLLGQGPFPKDAAMFVEISDESNRLATLFNVPWSKRTLTNHLHLLDIAGLHFNLFVGNRLPRDLLTVSVFRAEEQVVAIAKTREAYMRKLYGKHLRSLAETKGSPVP